MKIDFHIHSTYSRYKDDAKLVKFGTIDNIPTLVKQLDFNQINMCSITDHDFFSYELYQTLKGYENTGHLKKVFPGVEFSVGLKNDKGVVKPVHVICIFDDSDEVKVMNIQKHIPFEDGKIKYNTKNEYFSEEKFINILRNIDLSVVTIAHQKNSITSSSAEKSKNDVSSLGSVKSNELIMCEYFESFEFKNMKNGLYNYNYAMKKNENYDQIRFITGSDCHDWTVYPKHDKDEKENIEFYFTYLKCLPTFRGLSMAFSDTTRISTKDYVFSPRQKYVDRILVEINDEPYDIPLSKGINVIIGDNSIGKSLLLHKLTNYKYLKGKTSSVKNGYELYLNKNGISVNTNIDSTMIHTFDYQGGIRERFESDNQDNQEFLEDKFPPDLNKEMYKAKIMSYMDDLILNLKNKFEYDSLLKQLKSLVVIDVETETKNIAVKRIVNNKNDITKYNNLKTYYNGILTAINKKHDFIYEKDEIETIEKFMNIILEYVHKYEVLREQADKIYTLKNDINQGIAEFNKELESWRTENENNKIKFENEDSINLAITIAALLEKKKNLMNYTFNVKEEDIKPEKLKYGGYTFVKQFRNCRKIDNNYLDSVIRRVIKNNGCLCTNEITESELRAIIKDVPNDNQKKTLDIFKNKIEDIVNSDLEIIPLITKNGDNVYNKLSNGMNSSIYFDILSFDTKEGIYIVDQPEDDVSQNAIKSNILKNFKDMSMHRQIIMITHNPQFVVNLDVDNVICIEKENNNIVIQSGALEFLDEKTDIISTVAKNLDGGIESIRKRWKRYDKAIDVEE